MGGLTEMGMTPERLAEIEARCAAARPGPWRFVDPDGIDCIWMDVVDANDDEVVNGETLAQPHICADAEVAKQEYARVKADLEFVAHARTDIPDLLAEIREFREHLALST